ncbi:MAG: DNA-directed RNA polymerase subunit L [archaeon]
MELNILKEDKDMIEVELIGEGHTFANALKEELWLDDKVKTAAYIIEHPMKGNPRIIVRTVSGRTPKAALKGAAQRLEKKTAELEDKFKKAK